MFYLLFILNEVVLRQFSSFFYVLIKSWTAKRSNIGNKISVLLLHIETKILQLWLYNDSMCFPFCALIHTQKRNPIYYCECLENSLLVPKVTFTFYFLYFGSFCCKQNVCLKTWNNQKSSKQISKRMNFYVYALLSYRYVEQKSYLCIMYEYFVSLYLSALPQYVSNASTTTATAKRKLLTLKYTLCCFVCSHKIIK